MSVAAAIDSPLARLRGRLRHSGYPEKHPRTIGWLGTTALALGGSNQSLFLLGALYAGQGSGAVPLLVVGLLLGWAALPGWTELVLLWPNRVGGIASSCAEAFKPYSAVLANLTGVCYWWGWVPTCGLTAILSASALHSWYLPGVPVKPLAIAILLGFVAINLCGIRAVTRIAIPVAFVSALLAFLSGIVPVFAGSVDWQQATSFHLTTPFHGVFGGITSAMAGLYLIGFAAPAFEAAACHVGETKDPARNVPRAMYASAGLASVYFVLLPVVWLGVLGPGGAFNDLAGSLGPTFGPLLGSGAKAAAIWFMVFNMFHGTLQPIAGASRTLSQLSEDGLLPRVLALRSKRDVPWVATWVTALMAIGFLLLGDPTWLIAAANLTYLIGIGLPSVAVWLLRRNAPDMERPYRAPRFTIGLGVAAAGAWAVSTVLGFEQFGLPTVLAGLGFAYAGSVFYALRAWGDRRLEGRRTNFHSLHVKLTGAMLLVLVLDGAGYLIAVRSVPTADHFGRALLEDIFVAVALLTVTVGLVLPGMIAHTAGQVAGAADRLATGMVADLRRAMRALADGDLDAAHARFQVEPVVVHSRDELHGLALSFNAVQDEVGHTAEALDHAREGLRRTQDELRRSNEELSRWGEDLEQRVEERTAELRAARDVLASLATTDPLTGLANHRALVAAIDQELERSDRYGRPCALVFLDIDHFKRLNDQHGHAAGDTALQEIAGLAGGALRAIDTIGRWGGEEFVVLLPEAGEAEGLATAERLRRAVAGHAFTAAGGIRLTCSIGVATYPADAPSRSDLMIAADRAMYAAKRLGRNLSFAAAHPAVPAMWMGSDSPERAAGDAMLSETVEALALLVEARDNYTGMHAGSVSDLALRLALELGCDAEQVRLIVAGGRLHDVGKVAVPDAILGKPGPLDDAEWQVMRTHPEVGAEIVARIPSLRDVAETIRTHHERWDGAGYPQGLAGEAIPLGGRILAVADAYHAIISGRPYQDARSSALALAEIDRCAGGQFDPAVVAALQRIVIPGRVPDPALASGA